MQVEFCVLIAERRALPLSIEEPLLWLSLRHRTQAYGKTPADLPQDSAVKSMAVGLIILADQRVQIPLPHKSITFELQLVKI